MNITIISEYIHFDHVGHRTEEEGILPIKAQLDETNNHTLSNKLQCNIFNKLHTLFILKYGYRSCYLEVME